LAGADIVLRRAVSSHGVCPVDLPGEPARDRDLPVGAGCQALCHGVRRPGATLDPGRCQWARDWRIYAELAQRLIVQARRLYTNEDLGFDLANTLDSTTIDLCLAVFPWAHFRTTKAAVKMHTLLDLRGNIPSFIHVSGGKLHDVHALDLLLPEAGAIYVMDRGYVDFAASMGCISPAPSSSPAPNRT
jgi:hypothetical protein